MSVSGLTTRATTTPATTPVLSITKPTATSVTIDARLSRHGGAASGAVLGRHSYQINTERNNLDVLAGSTPTPTTAGINVDFDGIDTYSKNISGNSWNTWFQSTDPIGEALIEDFAVTWLVESIAGTIREMAGLDNDPSANASFNSGEYMLYQINGNLIQCYENGSNRSGSISKILDVGDRLGIKVVNGVVSYIHIRSGVEEVLYTSLAKAESTYFLKAALNRGNASSGHSVIGGVETHKTMMPSPVSVQVSGSATEVVSPDDAAKFESVGLTVGAGSTYSLINAVIEDTPAFPLSTSREVMHDYSVSASQAIGVF